LYYKLYQTLRKVKTNDTPATNAMILLSVTQAINIVTIQVLINYFFNVKLLLRSKYEIIIFAVSFMLIIYLINYFHLYKKHEKINEHYKNESKNKSTVGFIIMVMYILGSFILLFFIGTKYPIYKSL
jgi:dolichol kinase